MTPSFLERLDTRLRDGLRALSPALRDSTLACVAPFSTTCGGYRGRLGSADTYYTDFAARLLDLADAPTDGFERIGEYLRSLPPPGDLVDLFSRMNAARLVRRRAVTIPAPDVAQRILESQRVETGGFAQPGEHAPSAYLTFLAGLVCEMLGDPIPEPERMAAAIRALRQPSGGFIDRAGDALAQANTTSAAVAALGIIGAGDPQETAAAAQFLAGLQTPEGGFRAHRDAPESDLLSTFTSLTSLAGLGALHLVRLAPIGRFVLSLHSPGNGFCASIVDSECDIEYTFYGVGSLCLLQDHLNRTRNPGIA